MTPKVHACVALHLALAFAGVASAAPPRPNIVLILADDLGWGELGCYGQKKVRTPNLDRLAADGLRFTRHYAGAPVCAPSRNVLLTGLHTGHTPIRGNKQVTDASGRPAEGQHPIPADSLTIARVLKQAGYATAAIGKWGLGPVGSTGDPNRQGFDLFFGYNCQSQAHSYFPTHLWRNDQKVPINAKPIPGHARRPDGPVSMDDYLGQAYAPDLLEAEAVKFIADHARQPFFLYLPFTEPHAALHPPRRLVQSYPSDWDDHPYRGQGGYLPHPRPRAAYAALITSLDEHVGKVLAALDKANLRDNTLVLFTSDNGTTHRAADPSVGIGGVDAPFFASTAGLRGYKGSVHEGGIRVPLLVRWPGHVKPGTTSDFPCYFPDHFATLCDLLDLNPPGRRDGISLRPVLEGQGTLPKRNPLVWVFPEYGGQVAVRLGSYKAVRKDLARKQPGEWELYDLDRDPAEERDTAAEHPDIIARAVEVLRQEMDPNPVFPVRVPGVSR